MYLVKGLEGAKEEMTATEVADYFKLDLSKPVSFDQVGKRNSYDRLNNRQRRNKGFRLKTKFSGTINGKSVTFQYFTDKNHGDYGKIEFSPDAIHFPGNKTYFPESDVEQIVFLSLHPWNEKSPIFKQTVKSWTTIDRSAEAKKKLTLASIMSEVRTDILNLAATKPEALRRKAMGLLISNRHTISVTDFMERDEIAAALLDALETHKSAFCDAWKSNTTAIRGLIMDAIQKSIFTINRSSNTPGIFWTSGGDLVTNFGVSETPEIVLVDYALTNWSTFGDRLTAALSGKSIAEKAEALGDELDKMEEKLAAGDPSNITQMLDRAINIGVVKFDPVDDRVIFDSNGRLIAKTTAENWREDALTALGAKPTLAKQLITDLESK